jgi:predicted HTH domain antitoxin
MKKEQMVGTRLPDKMVRDLKAIEQAEQSDRSTIVRKLLSRAIQEWELEYYSRLYGSRRLTLARAAREAQVSLWEMTDYVKTKKIAAQYDLEDFQRDLKTVAAGEKRKTSG